MHARPACVYRDPRQPLSRIHLVAPNWTGLVMLTLSPRREFAPCRRGAALASRRWQLCTSSPPALRHPTSRLATESLAVCRARSLTTTNPPAPLPRDTSTGARQRVRTRRHPGGRRYRPQERLHGPGRRAAPGATGKMAAGHRRRDEKQGQGAHAPDPGLVQLAGRQRLRPGHIVHRRHRAAPRPVGRPDGDAR